MNSNPFTDFGEFEPRMRPGSPQGGPSCSPLPNESNLDYLTNESLDSRALSRLFLPLPLRVPKPEPLLVKTPRIWG